MGSCLKVEGLGFRPGAMDACSLSQGPGVQGFNSGLGGAREPRGSTRHSRGPARVRRVQGFRAPTHTHLDIASPTLSPPPPDGARLAAWHGQPRAAVPGQPPRVQPERHEGEAWGSGHRVQGSFFSVRGASLPPSRGPDEPHIPSQRPTHTLTHTHSPKHPPPGPGPVPVGHPGVRYDARLHPTGRAAAGEGAGLAAISGLC